MAPTVLSSILASPSVHASWETHGSMAHDCRYTLPLPSNMPDWDSPIIAHEALLSTFCLRNAGVTIYIFSCNKRNILHVEHKAVPPVRAAVSPCAEAFEFRTAGPGALASV